MYSAGIAGHSWSLAEVEKLLGFGPVLGVPQTSHLAMASDKSVSPHLQEWGFQSHLSKWHEDYQVTRKKCKAAS